MLTEIILVPVITKLGYSLLSEVWSNLTVRAFDLRVFTEDGRLNVHLKLRIKGVPK